MAGTRESFGHQIKVEQRPAQLTGNKRLVIVDIARGVAILLMFAYHFSFDLNYYGFVRFDFHHAPFWVNARTFIVSLFLLLVGVSLFLAHAGGIRWPAVGRRTLQIGAAAALVSAGSYLLFPRSYIFFGVLHFIALASLLALPFLRYRWIALTAGLGLLWLGAHYTNPLFDRPMLNWIGLVTRLPITEDYVPLVPWLGMVLIGVFLGSWVSRSRKVLAGWQGKGTALSGLGWAGRHRLLLYLLHQPLFLGVLYLVVQLR